MNVEKRGKYRKCVESMETIENILYKQTETYIVCGNIGISEKRNIGW